MRPDAISRRTLLAASAAGTCAVTLSGCQGDRWYPPTVTPDGSLLRAVVADKERMVAHCEAVLAADPDAADLVTEVLEHHQRHLEVLRDRVPPDEDPAPSPANSAGTDPETTLAALVAEEDAAATRRVRQAAQAQDPALAQLLASVGACEASHAFLVSGG